MLAVATRFLAGRYHATPWGRHVNEAAPEWPPSPWRLLRALVATWKRKLDGDPLCAPGVIEALLRKIATPPSFVLPPAATGHTRHYMPWFKKGPEDRTLVFDAFVALERAERVVAVWPDVVLDDAERRALDRLTESLGFMGRSESWVDATVLPEAEAAAAASRITCAPAGGASPARESDPVRVLCADAGAAFANAHTPKREVTDGCGRAKRTVLTPVYDPDWHLCMETLELHNRRWSSPPGATWVTYLRPSDCFAVTPRRSTTSGAHGMPTVARFALDAVVLPLVEETLRVAEQARITAMGCYRRAEERRLYRGNPPAAAPPPRSTVLSGKDEGGSPLRGHGHAHYLPTDEDGDGRLDHVTIVAGRGFGPAELRAFDRMRILRFRDREPVRLVLVGLGQREGPLAPAVLGPSRIWISATPFLATRHPKRNGRRRDPPALLARAHGRAFVRQNLLEELARMRALRPELPEPSTVEPLNDDHRCGAHHLRPIQFRRFRQKPSDDGGRRPAGAFRIVFPTPVCGPICLGHSSHFGLGLFVPDASVRQTQSGPT
jgi:CRISPR-associated protein Csb2